jgi:hypothetical protein
MKVNNQKECKEAEFNTKGWCDHGDWSDYFCMCRKFKFLGFGGKERSLVCPYAYIPYRGKQEGL